MFRVGDKIKVLDDDQKGVILAIHRQSITILNEDGFEEIYASKELILDQTLDVGEVQQPVQEVPKKVQTHQAILAPKEIDLHIGQLVDYFKGLSNYEMLQIQIKTIRAEIEWARAEKRTKIIFIHGHGSGKLKKEMIKVLQSYTGIEFYDASYQKFRGGATEVVIR